jgi:hypothetical protein
MNWPAASTKIFSRMFDIRRWFWMSLIVALISIDLPSTSACPFCSATAQTLRQDMQSMDVVGLGTLVPSSEADINGNGQFELIKVWRGDSLVANNQKIEAPYFGPGKSDKKFLLLGIGTEEVLWSSPLPVSEAAENYLEAVSQLKDEGPSRLRFFLQYLESSEPMLARDAYEEFAQAPYDEVKAIRDALDRKQLIAWCQDINIAPDRKRLYFTLLGICGTQEDTAFLEDILRAETPEGRAGLDACIGCYLTLKGEAGLPLINELFLKNHQCPYPDTYAAVMALRFHGTEGGVIDRSKVVQSMRLMLERDEFADLVIPDLARWEDWSQIDRLVKLFEDAKQGTSWVRVPVVNYLRACPLPEAKEKIEYLETIDPKAVKRAATFFPIPVPNSQPAAPDANDSSSIELPTQLPIMHLPLGARNRRLAANGNQVLTDSSLVLAPRPTLRVNQSMLVFVMATSFVMLGLVMWLIIAGGHSATMNDVYSGIAQAVPSSKKHV